MTATARPPAGTAGRAPSAAPRSGTLPLVLFASTLTVMAGSILAPVVQVIREDLALSGTAAGLIVTAHSLAIAVASPLAGWMLDRWGLRLPLAGGLVVYGLAGATGLVTEDYAALIAGRMVFGVGAALVFTGTTLALLNLYQGSDRERAMGWRSTATSLGGVLWPLLAGAVGGISWHLPFGVYLLGLPLGVATLFLLPGGSPAGAGGPAERIGTMTLLRRHRVLLVWYALQFSASLLLYALLLFLPQRLSETGVDDPLLVSLYTVGMSATMSVIGLFYAPLGARLGRLALLRGALALWAAAFLLLAVAPSAPLLFLAPVLFGLGQGVFFPVTTVLIGEEVPVAVRGKATALSGTAAFAGQFASPLLVGPLIQATSPTTGFLVATALPVLALAAVWRVRAEAPRPADAAGDGPEAAAATRTTPTTQATPAAPAP
ncbi:MFS transporter [Streptomyces filamentosus]|uniref:MFS transporter n=1 Tax=Streptomyces filamentosus TaxID=67294 RepID=UPI003814F574